MKTIFDEAARNSIIARIHALPATNSAQWGKMNVFQMVKHCHLWESWVHGKNEPVYKQAFIGYVFGKMALRKMIRDDSPLDKKVPTSTFLKIKEESGDFELLKKEWVELIAAYENYSNPAFVHDFFGKMTKEQLGILAYKHTDHHLRQFGA